MSELHQAKLVPTQFTVPKPGEHAWSPAEQRRFWEGIQRFPYGPWTAIAAYVGSKSTRQAMTHAQKLRQKLSRWKRRVRSDSVSSTGSNSHSKVSGTTPWEEKHGVNSPPMSPTEYGKIVMMDHIEEEDEEENERDGEGAEFRPMKSERPHAMQQLEDPNQVDPAPPYDDRYLEHLLSDIEPVLDHVVHFTNGSHHRGNDGTPQSETTTASDKEQALYFTHHAEFLAASENKTAELSMYYPHQHQCTLPAASTARHYTPTETGHQHHCYHL